MVVGVAAQNPKHFTKDGLSFDYPDGWTIADESTSDAQQLTLSRSDSEAMIKFFVHRGKVNTPEKLALAKTKIIEPVSELHRKAIRGDGRKAGARCGNYADRGR